MFLTWYHRKAQAVTAAMKSEKGDAYHTPSNPQNSGNTEQSRNQEQALPAQAKEHRFPGNTDALEKLADGYLRTDNDEHHQTDPQAVGRHLDQLRIAGERTGYQPRKQDARQTAQPHDNCRSDDDQPQGVLHALMLSGTVIEPDDRLHPLRDTDNKHHQQHADTGNDAVGSQRQVAPVHLQGIVLDNDDQATRPAAWQKARYRW